MINLKTTDQKQEFHWKIENSAKLPTVKIDLYGYVGGSAEYEDGFNETEFAKQFRKIDSTRPIDISINSFGGSVYTGLAIYSLLKTHQGKINIRVDGAAMSAATLITSVPNATVTMPLGSMMMIHEVSAVAYGSARQMQKTAEDIRKLEENIIEIYAAKCGKDPKDIREKIEAESYFNAREAVEYGLADVVDESSSVKNLRTPTNVLINGLPADSKYFEHAPAEFFTAVAQAPADNVNPPPKKETKMDLEQLKAEYPDLVASLQAEAVKQGVENEKKRIQALEELALAGHSDLLGKAKADSSITPEMFAVQLVKAEKAKKAQIQKNIEQDAAELKNVKADSNFGFETADAKAQQDKQAENEKDQQERDALVKAAAAQFNK